MPQNNNSFENKDLRQPGKSAYKPAYKNISEIAENETQIDTQKLPIDLAEIVTVWHKLPEHIKAAIKALVQTHIQGEQVNGKEKVEEEENPKQGQKC